MAGELISDAHLIALTKRVEAANAGEPISFFEITTVLALLAFAETPADLCVVEVGLGGRFDATNVFEAPAVSVIAPVDYDHLEFLGPALSKIAWEKAGVIKPSRPVVVARQAEEALEMIEREADAQMAPMLLMGRDFDAWEEPRPPAGPDVRAPARPAAAQSVRRPSVCQRRPGGGRGPGLRP